ncbi:hypothetical protein [Natrinema pallidum]|uniref:Uncharacterized protein n=1 Tax=Natrinema pallidum TaxID=69527 RepID=A0A4P9TH75_9EURY|nr:hypothetical protein [Natrinema pallidum]QCW03465.1 hypothetical protein FGF80_09510 [Natrinema pallidum]
MLDVRHYEQSETIQSIRYLLGPQHFLLPLCLRDWAPDKNNSGELIGGVELDSISFGADGSGPYGEVSISPSSTKVAKQYDETNFADDGPVKTVYDISGADDEVKQQLGNSAAFVTIPDARKICSARVIVLWSQVARLTIPIVRPFWTISISRICTINYLLAL